MGNQNLALNEKLTFEMTNLANERSLLAYMRTFVVFLSSGIAILKFELFQNLILLAYFLITFSLISLVIGITRFWQVNKLIKKMVSSKINKRNK